MLRRLRSSKEDVEAEIKEIKENQEAGGFRAVFEPPGPQDVAVGVLLAILQQVTGINTVIYYAPTLLHGAGFGNSASLLANVGVGVVNVGLTIVAIWALDKVGRRPLLIGGTCGMVVGMAILGSAFAIAGGTLHGTTAILALCGLGIFTGSFAIGSVRSSGSSSASSTRSVSGVRP